MIVTLRSGQLFDRWVPEAFVSFDSLCFSSLLGHFSGMPLIVLPHIAKALTTDWEPQSSHFTSYQSGIIWSRYLVTSYLRHLVLTYGSLSMIAKLLVDLVY